MKQWNLFIAFFRVGMLGYGGGPSSIPLVHKEVVEKYKWLTDDDFGDVLALGNSLPGPIATKMAGYIGYRVSGIFGMLNAVIATILPTIVIMIVLITSLNSFRNQPWVAGMTNAVIPVVGVMLAKLTYDFFNKAKVSMGWTVSILLGSGSLALIVWAGIHPGIIIFALLLYALLRPKKKKDMTLNRQEQSS
ncbi:chromate transporter [Thalassobacillus pellis]|uniref:chromate transporter n=1 Tax=Thalassobacillus pellis TaxID=748008 RepID=UPI00195FE3C3|nr:chromate transporter [Thalassobacillus pellis]MBM7553055.1 chromate transporter [Thalassobacillus pellis]